MKGKKNQHEWEYMGHSKDWKVEYGYCPLCNQWRKSDSPKLFKMKPGDYEKKVKAGEIIGI